jgi:hypothetical protein
MSRATRITLACSGTLLAAMLVTLAVGVRNLNRAARRSSEAERLPLKALGTIHMAQIEYYDQFGHYAASLEELGPAANGTGGFIEPALASGESGGYKFTLTSTPTGYTISAVGGTRTYLSDQTMKIHVHVGPEPATISDPVLVGPPTVSDPPEIRPPGTRTPQPPAPESSELYSYPPRTVSKDPRARNVRFGFGKTIKPPNLTLYQ